MTEKKIPEFIYAGQVYKCPSVNGRIIIITGGLEDDCFDDFYGCNNDIYSVLLKYSDNSDGIDVEFLPESEIRENYELIYEFEENEHRSIMSEMIEAFFINIMKKVEFSDS